MNEGVGSTSVIVIIVVFIAIVSSYMAYNVNYTKAFRMKNKIISLYEEYDGNCDSSCSAKIQSYAQDIGYAVSAIDSNACRNNPFIPNSDSDEEVTTETHAPYYCAYKVKERKSGHSSVFKDNNSEPGFYYRVVTRIDIEIPIIQNVMNLRVLNVSGDTKTFKQN